MVALTSYLGVSGLDYSAKDGVLYQDSRVRIADVLDGTSNTLLFGERPPSADYQFGWWYAGTGQQLTGSADVILGVRELNIMPIVAGSVCGPGRYQFGPSSPSDPCAWYHYWSLHAAGASFAMSDGSVRFVRYEAARTLPALASRAGGEVEFAP